MFRINRLINYNNFRKLNEALPKKQILFLSDFFSMLNPFLTLNCA